MVQVYLYGRLGKIIGKHFNLHCSKLQDVLTAIECNTGKLRKYLSLNKKRFFGIFVDDEHVDWSEAANIDVRGKTVRILPIIMGGVGTTIVATILGVSLATATTGQLAAIFIIGGLINAALSFGISMLIQKMLAPDDPGNATSTNSFSFNGAENIAQQGIPVPVGYGRLIVGSRIISVNTFHTDLNRFKNEDFYKIKNSSGSSAVTEAQIYQSEKGGAAFNG